MKLGKNAHSILPRYLRKKSIVARMMPEYFLRSVGGISYFLNDEKISTRIYLQNYLALLSDSPDVHAKWHLDLYSSAGEKVFHKEGVFTGYQGAVIEVSTLENVGEYGVIHAGLYLQDKDLEINKPLLTVFFTEFSQRNTQYPRKLISHSLGAPAGGIYTYDRSATGLAIPSGSIPHLLIANGTTLKSEMRAMCATGALQITNADGKVLHIPLPNIKESLGSRKVDLFNVCPAMEKHVGTQPFGIKIKGTNILGKPFLLITGEHVLLGDHL